MVEMTQDQLENFGSEFLSKYLAGGFGSMTKTEMDTLVFHLLSDSASIKDQTNYKIANTLQISERKVKSLKLAAALRHRQPNHKAILADVVTQITTEMAKPEFESGKVTISIEDPVVQRELEHAIKSAGRYVEYGFNRELFKITPIALFELVVSNLENPDREFKEIIQNFIEDQELQRSIIDDALTLPQQLRKVGEEIKDKAGLIRLLGAAAGSL